MATTCLQLLQLRSFQKISLVAGKSGLYRKLSWPHICVMPSIAQWLHGGELLFITGTSFEPDEETVMELLHEAVQENLAGIVLLVGGETKLTITDALRAYADKNEFPLFEMPWELKLVDVIQEISEMIISQKNLGDTRQRFFFELLFSPDHPRKFEDLSSLYGVPMHSHLAVAILHPCTEQTIDLSDIIHKLSYHQSLNQKIPDATLIPAKHIGNIICLVMANSEKALRKTFATLEHFVNIFAPKYYHEGYLKLAFSHIAPPNTPLQQLYSEADMVLRIITRTPSSTNHLYYDQLGVYKLFFEVPEEIRKTFYSEHLGLLIHEDQTNNSNLVETLRCYLTNNCSAVAASQQLFIHKNTLFYRINRIKTILNVDLNDPFIRNNLFNALLIYDVFSDAT